jgi:AraC-like DNA-binding protein
MAQKPRRQLPQLAALFDHLDDVVAWTKDRRGRYAWVNRAFLLNLDAAARFHAALLENRDPVGKTDHDISPAFLADQYRLDDDYVLSGQQLVNRIELVGQPDGMTVWNVTNKAPLVDAQGRIIGTAGMTRRLDALSAESRPSAEFGAVLAYMSDHYHEVITNRELAKLAHLSVRAFERRFTASFHLTPQKYLRALQMRMAARALVYTSTALSNVAADSGFSDQSHFSREFRRHFGCTPREYRQRYASENGGAAFSTKPAADIQSPPRGAQ